MSASVKPITVMSMQNASIMMDRFLAYAMLDIQETAQLVQV